jgi:hypothetical protein
MKRFTISYLSLGLVCLLATTASAQQPAPVASDPSQERRPSERTESLAAWKWYEELQLPEAKRARFLDCLLSPSVFDKARVDLGDLRLYDARQREIPYSLRVRRAEDKQEPLSAREFNRATNPDVSVELSLDLGESSSEHNQMEIRTNGTNFRRRVRIEGSDTGKDWSAILDKAYLVHYQVDSRLIDIHSIRYSASRFRYVRLKVFPESGNDEDTPSISSATIYRSTQIAGEYVTRQATLGNREPVKAFGGPGSAWYIDFGGREAAPCEQLSFDIFDDDFVRTYQLERADEDGAHEVIARGEWRRRAGVAAKPMEIRFAEVTTRRLRLIVTDYRNSPLSITAVRYTAPARQLVFANTTDLTAPLRLYFGNPKAEPPRYDFAANLPAKVEPAPVRATLDPAVENPEYRPKPKPWTEKWPWLVYVVLGTASIVLLGILAALARGAIARHDASQHSERQSVGS